ncbi:hypothetical protein ADK86_27360 [Streptomyces sp. NRRL F-5755]|nr:hypothetical protein ADK86_27360 [Streptomyces sp. NRRL F-5755]
MSALPSLPAPDASVTPANRTRGRLVLLGLILIVVGVVAAAVFLPEDASDEAATLQAGECFQNTGTTKDPEVNKLGCTDSHADYKVLKTIKGGVSGTLECADVRGATGSLTQVGTESFVVCFADNKR